MQKVETLLVCDLCGADESKARVKRHTLRLNNREVEGEACEVCIEKVPVVKLIRSFRRPGRPPRKIA